MAYGIRALFSPQRVAVIGASRSHSRIGSEILGNLLDCKFHGSLAVVHPSEKSLQGVPAYPSISDVPGPVDLAIICVPAPAVPALVGECVAAGVKSLCVISAGFSETGEAGKAREREIRDICRRAGVRMVGPNCMGLINTDPAVSLNATFSPVFPPIGRVAMSTQSGALGLAILDYASRLHIGLSTFISIGNKADVSGNDLIEYWSDDPNTDVILLYVESFGNPRKFSQLARQVGRRKPIVAVKSGRSRAGARAAASHTGALASSDVILDALFRQAGVIRTDTLEELFDVAALVSNQPVPHGRRVAILTNAGGPAILAADACEARGLELPTLSPHTVATLRAMLPAAAAVGNPVDMIASATAEQYEQALTALLADDVVDSVLVIFIPPLVTHGEDVARAIRSAAGRRHDKPIAAVFMSSRGAPPRLAPIPAFMFPEAAAVALARVANYGEWRRRPETPPRRFTDVDVKAAREIVSCAIARGQSWLSPIDAARLIEAFRIPMARTELADSEETAVTLARQLGFPVAAKVFAPDVVHKTDVGGVAIGLADENAVRETWRQFKARVPGMTGMVVQAMAPKGVEMLIGAVHDPAFGPVVACATGGTLAELFADSQFRLTPLGADDAHSMVEGLRGAALLRGYRGAPPADTAALEDALMRLSALIEACPEIDELDLNPVIVGTKGALAVDVRVRVTARSTNHGG